MCGIVAGLAQRDISKILIEGLHRLEYRGYDSAGVAVIDPAGELRRARAVGKVRALEDELREAPLDIQSRIGQIQSIEELATDFLFAPASLASRSGNAALYAEPDQRAHATAVAGSAWF